jgi:hypothetical protein
MVLVFIFECIVKNVIKIVFSKKILKYVSKKITLKQKKTDKFYKLQFTLFIYFMYYKTL